MAYSIVGWVNRVTQKVRTYRETTNQDGSKTFTPVPGTVVSEGTPLSAENLSHMDEGIFNNAEDITALKNTFDGTPFVIAGSVSVANVPGSGRLEVPITFTMPFSQTPLGVVACLAINSTTEPAGIGRMNVAVSPSTITKNGFTAIIYSDSTRAHQAVINYMACGINHHVWP